MLRTLTRSICPKSCTELVCINLCLSVEVVLYRWTREVRFDRQLADKPRDTDVKTAHHTCSSNVLFLYIIRITSSISLEVT